MKDILLKRNELRDRSQALRFIKFDDKLNYEQTKRIAQEQNKIYGQWKFYDRFIKAREEVKNEIELDNVGKGE